MVRSSPGLLLSILVLSCVAACEQPAPVTEEIAGDPIRGSAYAQLHCARCHATEPAGDSPYLAAPPFRTLYQRYPVENLAEALAEGIGVGHRGPVEMPEFVLSPEEIDDLLAHLKSLEPGA